MADVLELTEVLVRQYGLCLRTYRGIGEAVSLVMTLPRYW